MKVAYPETDIKDFDDYLDSVLKKKLKDTTCFIDNNYIKKTVKTSLLNIFDWLTEKKPIIAGNGTFFKNQNQAKNPAAVMLDEFLSTRKVLNDEKKRADPNSYEYMTKDRGQKNEKIAANSYYGASGAPTSELFNLYTAGSVTGTGQSLISTTAMLFESFLGDNCPFYDTDDCLLFIYNILKEKRYTVENFIPSVNIEKVFERLTNNFKYKDKIKSETYQALINYEVKITD